MGWLSGWGKRIKITVDQTKVDGALSDFPVLVYLSTTSGISDADVSAVFDELGANSKKIAVTTSDGETQCYVEIENWNNTTEKAYLWVKAPSVSDTTDTDLYLYFDGSQADNTSYVNTTANGVSTNVWDSDFIGVYHLSESGNGTSGEFKDSTGNALHGTGGGGDGAKTPAQDTGTIYKAQHFDASNDFIQTPASLTDALDNAAGATIEHLVRLDGVAAFTFVGIGITGYNHRLVTALDSSGYFFARGRVKESESAQTKTSSATYSSGPSFLNFAVTYDVPGDAITLYKDGASIAATGTIAFGESVFYAGDTGVTGAIGANAIGTSGFLNGAIDELRISKTARSAAWLKASYYSNNDNLISFGSVEEPQAHNVFFKDTATYKWSTLFDVDFDVVTTTTSSTTTTSTTTSSSTSSSSSTTFSTTSSTWSTTSTFSTTSSSTSSSSTTTTTTSPPRQEHTINYKDYGTRFKDTTGVLWKRFDAVSVAFKNTAATIFKNSFVRWFRGQPVIKSITVPYSLAMIYSELQAIYSLRGPVYSEIAAPYNLAATVTKDMAAAYSLLAVNKISADAKAIYSLIESPAVNYRHTITAKCNGSSVNVQSLSISCDEASYCFSFSAALADYDSWNVCLAGREITVSINGDSYTFIIDARSRQRVFGSTAYTIQGRSKTKLLDFPDADPVTQTYGAATASSICSSLCAAEGISLSWEIENWTIPANTLVADSESPLSIMGRIAAAAGAVLQTSKDGQTLIVRYSYPVSPTCYADSAADLTLTDATDILDVTEQLETRKGYNKVRVSSKEIVDEKDAYIYIELDEVRNNGKSVFLTTDTVYLRIYSNIEYTVVATAGTIVKTVTGETLAVENEIVPFVHDEYSSLAKPVDSISSITWMGNDLGSLSIIGSTQISAALATATSLGIGKITYNTEYDVWELRPPATITDQYQIYILSAQEVTT